MNMRKSSALACVLLSVLFLSCCGYDKKKDNADVFYLGETCKFYQNESSMIELTFLEYSHETNGDNDFLLNCKFDLMSEADYLIAQSDYLLKLSTIYGDAFSKLITCDLNSTTEKNGKDIFELKSIKDMEFYICYIIDDFTIASEDLIFSIDFMNTYSFVSIKR